MSFFMTSRKSLFGIETVPAIGTPPKATDLRLVSTRKSLFCRRMNAKLSTGDHWYSETNLELDLLLVHQLVRLQRKVLIEPDAGAWDVQTVVAEKVHLLQTKRENEREWPTHLICDTSCLALVTVLTHMNAFLSRSPTVSVGEYLSRGLSL